MDKTEKEIFNKIKKMLLDLSDNIDEHEIVLGASFIDDLGMDSLDVVEFVMEMEKEFNMDIPDEDVEKIPIIQNVIIYTKIHRNSA